MYPPVRYSDCTNISFTGTGKTFNACINVTNLQLNSKNDVPVGERVAFTFIFALLLLVSLAGNIIVLVTLLRKSLPPRSIYIYTINLASTDLLLTLSLVLRAIARNMTGRAGDEIVCKLSHFTIETTLIASVLTLVAIGYKRYNKVMSLNIATLHSWNQERRVARKQCWVIWLIAGISASPFLSARTVNHKSECIIYETWSAVYVKVYLVSHFVLFFVFPFLFLTFVQCRIYCFLRSHTVPNAIEPSTNHPSQNVYSPTNPHQTRMLLAIIVVFLLCFGPVIVTRALAPFWVPMDSLPHVYNRISQLLLVFNPAINPWIYCVSNSEIRNACKKSLTCT